MSEVVFIDSNSISFYTSMLDTDNNDDRVDLASEEMVSRKQEVLLDRL